MTIFSASEVGTEVLPKKKRRSLTTSGQPKRKKNAACHARTSFRSVQIMVLPLKRQDSYMCIIICHWLRERLC